MFSSKLVSSQQLTLLVSVVPGSILRKAETPHWTDKGMVYVTAGSMYRNHRIIKLLALWNLKRQKQRDQTKEDNCNTATFQTPCRPRLQGSTLEDPLSEKISTRWTQQMKPLGAAWLAELRA